MLQSLATTSLYYPFIEIPEPTLVHSLLFKERIKRIIPPLHAVGDDQREAYDLPNKISKQILGYEFIEEADYYDSRSDIAEAFVDLLTDAHSADNPGEFETLFGKNYQSHFNLKKTTIIGSVQYFIYAHKFDEKVFAKLEEIGWVRGGKLCELRNELCNVYMTLLAAAISKCKREPISTGLKESEEILRNPTFQRYFAHLLPLQLQGNSVVQELCLTVLLSGNLMGRSTTKLPAIHEILSFREAVYIRASLEKSRRDFCQAVDEIVGKIIAIGPQDPEALVRYEVKEVVEAAREYKDKIDREMQKHVSDYKKDLRTYVRTGISLTFPVLGVIVDSLLAGAPTMLLGSATGTTISLLSFIALQRAPKPVTKNEQRDRGNRENAYLFLNQLWDLQEDRR